MQRTGLTVILLLLLLTGYSSFAQTDTIDTDLTVDSLNSVNDSINAQALQDYNEKLAEIEKQRKIDSLKKAELEAQLKDLKTTDNLRKEELIQQLREIEESEKRRIAEKKNRIDSLRKTAKGYPVTGVMKDTLFYIYSKIGASTPKERAVTISRKIEKLYDDDFWKADSLATVKSENVFDIIYDDMIIMSVSENDAIWYGKDMEALSKEFTEKIKSSILFAKEERSLLKVLIRIGLVLIVIFTTGLVIWLIGKAYKLLINFIDKKKENWLKDLSYKDYTFLTAEQEVQILLFFLKIFRWFTYAILLYLSLPVIFSIFPFSRTWADALFQLIWSPFKGMLLSIWGYFPNLITILVIVFVMRYVIKFVKYIFSEIEAEKLNIPGFHSDWAMPTYSIVRFLLYAFMFVLIFPYLPGSDSEIFKGVSVFIGILLSLGSSTAIANMVAGLVITYMRPFKIGDRITIGSVTGDVIEKTLLVTRLRTPKNEEITIPNSAVLSGNTTNFSTMARQEGLIVHTTVTIGYDVPWRKVHKVLLTAADRTQTLQKNPKPFVLQTGLEDFYVAYQLNAYTKGAEKQAGVYSELHQNIQDCFNEADIEILSPHYRAARDGNMITIPADYLPEGYQAPAFRISTDKKDE
jgi:small-conductance mechanosensitive channel